jgi:hypothetical protein
MINIFYLMEKGMERYIESFRCASIITNINRIVYLLDGLTEEDVMIDRDLDVPNWNIKLGRTPKTARNIFEHDPIRGNEGISSCIIPKCVNLVFYYPPANHLPPTALPYHGCVTLPGRINRMVYQLYGLTEEEIAIVENFR